MQAMKDILQNCQEEIQSLRDELLAFEKQAIAHLDYSKGAYSVGTKLTYLKSYKENRDSYNDLSRHIDELEDILKCEAYNRLIDLL